MVLIGPMMPHLAEESGQQLGAKNLAVDAPWPKADPALTRQDTVVIAVQVDGKRRGEIEMPKDSAAPAVEAVGLPLDALRKAHARRQDKKVLIVPNPIQH